MRSWRAQALIACAALLVSCTDAPSGGATRRPGDAKPTRGGSLTYALDAETPGGFCLPEAQLSGAGITVARAVYDTLTAPNASGDVVPYLAKSVEPNATFDRWTIRLRENIVFHDGSRLDAQVVKNNLDAYRGAYPARRAVLFMFVFDDIDAVTVVDDLTVEVATATPWPSLPAHLFGSGRVGIMAQSQLDDADGCHDTLVGTGPFQLDEWVPDQRLVVVRNRAYWQRAGAGERLPYLDRLVFRPISEGEQRLNALTSGEVDALQTSSPPVIDEIRRLAESGEVQNTESDEYSEVGYLLLNVSKPPFDNILARRAVAHALDRDTINELGFSGLLSIADGPFGPSNMGHLDETGFPDHDVDKARELAAQYERESAGTLEFTISVTSDTGSVQIAEMLQRMMDDAGIAASIRTNDQARQIDEAIAGDFQSMLWRNHPGGDPDTQYVWWHSSSPTNFGRIDDPEVDRLLDAGRTTADPAARAAIYEDLNRRFGEQVYNLWFTHMISAVATDDRVHGVLGPDLPDGGGRPFEGLAAGHPLLGLWIEEE